LTFVADDGVKKSLAVAQILDQLALEKQKNDQAKALGQGSHATLDENEDETDDIDDDLDDAEFDDDIENEDESDLHAEGDVDPSLETKPSDDPIR
jgi:hypothetical protein